MKNNKGFGIQELIIFIGIGCAAIFLFTYVVNSLVAIFKPSNSGTRNYKNVYSSYQLQNRNIAIEQEVNKTKYINIEKNIESKIDKYIDDNYEGSTFSDPLYIRTSTLVSKKYLTTDDLDICKGYVKVDNDYKKAYINCNNLYTTSGYVEGIK